MKILVDHQIFCEQRTGGVSRYHMELAKSLTAQFGDEVTIPAGYVENVYLADYLHKQPKVFKPRLADRLYQLNTLSVLMLLRLRKFDVVHLTWYNPRMVRACRDKKLVITVHDMVQEVFGLDPVTVERKKQAIYAADGIIAISQSTKRDILKFYPDIPEEKIEVIYHGTNHLAAPTPPESFRLPQNYLLFVGKRGDYKNAAFLMESLAPKLKKEKDLHLVFVGGGAFSHEEQKLLDELGIRDQVIQSDTSDAELAYIYQNAVCFIYPSKYEGFGFPILEAFDNRCPVLCSNTSSLPEVGGDAAMYFSPEDGKQLLEKVDALLSDPALREQYIQRGAERVREFTWDRTAQRTRAFYARVGKGQ